MPLLEATKPEPSLNFGRILLVEDEELIRDAIALALREEGYEVVVASDGRQALTLTQGSYAALAGGNRDLLGVAPEAASLPPHFDLMILDLMLPGINGLDLCRLVRREGNNVPILILSARGSETDRVVGLEVGADDYLTKPFGMRELVARCRALLRRHRLTQTENQPPILRFQEIALYPQECRVVVRESEVNLSPKEFRLLELFMSYPRRVWSREQLLERVWGPDFMGDSKTVDVHIRWLREKLEVDPSNPDYLITVRGFGYRFG
ncbi:response regulator transcription factor [Trichothermofontia sichuanensis B231]|uniref:winged helix-turn-helix domain-containing protein n=1 Tax=Trichothermofontia sichuanensis TaxID=3045816 RepID=UPI00224771BD|nr:response regulator transcription factor [Trichothermofontia sichuanensis]UZQ53125.1 response regulator transcription factor [Trichothermofontia sichuanensis B231]